MKKYILKKDLPLAKAGTIVTLRKSETASNIFNENNNRIYAIIDNTDINEWLEEITEKPKSVWDLKDGDEYYVIGIHSSIQKNIWSDSCSYKYEREIGDIFVTREEGCKELEKRRAIQKINKYCSENNIDRLYNDNSVVFYINEDNDVRYWNYFRVGSPIGYFSIENAQKILDNFEEELKIILK